MCTTEGHTGKDSDIILMEYCEEYAPLLSQVGQATRIKNYYKRRAGNVKGSPEYQLDAAFMTDFMRGLKTVEENEKSLGGRANQPRHPSAQLIGSQARAPQQS